MARVSQLHAAYHKTPVYSMPDYGPFEVFADLQTTPPGCVKPEEAVVAALEGLPWMRFYEVWPSHNAQTAVAGYCERNVRNALREAELGIRKSSTRRTWLASCSSCSCSSFAAAAAAATILILLLPPS